jgi:hypothetical protein
MFINHTKQVVKLLVRLYEVLAFREADRMVTLSELHSAVERPFNVLSH